MDDLLRFLKVYEVWIYILLGGVGLIGLRNVLRAWEEWRSAVFGLERESALLRLRAAMTLLFLALGMVLFEFVVVSFVYPAQSAAQPLPTPTLALLETPYAALEVTPVETQVLAVETPTAVVSEGCLPGQIEWTYPQTGTTLRGKVVLRGTVNVPNLGFYKYEYRSRGSEEWLTIAAGNRPIVDQALGGEGSGEWDTSMIPAGDYDLRLVVYDNANQPYPACVVTVRILPADGG